eukprot:5015578-Prymnesium_polylepis.2
MWRTAICEVWWWCVVVRCAIAWMCLTSHGIRICGMSGLFTHHTLASWHTLGRWGSWASRVSSARRSRVCQTRRRGEEFLLYRKSGEEAQFSRAATHVYRPSDPSVFTQ